IAQQQLSLHVRPDEPADAPGIVDGQIRSAQGGGEGVSGLTRDAVHHPHSVFAIALIFAIGGCAASKREMIVDRAVMDYYAGDYQRAREALIPLSEKTDEDFVLNNARLGSASLVDYHLDEAEAAFL